MSGRLQSLMMLLAVMCLLSVATAFRFATPSSRWTRSQTTTQLKAFDISQATTLLTSAIAEAKPDDYVYGAVSAPSWVLPVGCVFVVLSAGIPILLRPGEKALEQQRADEESTNNQFNKRRNKDLR